MFKLVRLAVYAVLGYAIYQFVTDVISSADQAREAARKRAGRGKAGGAARMSGKRKGPGKVEETQDVDGGSTRHRTGRGVI